MSDQNLITEAQLQNLLDQLANASNGLNTHAAQHYSSVHCLWTQTNTVTLDSAGHNTGRNAIRVKVGSTYYLLPADTLPGGPPKTAKITTQPKNTTSHAGPGDPQPRITFTVAATGSLPITFTWQIWSIALGQFVDRVAGNTGPGFSGTTWTVFNITSTPTSSALELDSTSPGAGTYNPATYVRCKVTNAGGTIYSNQATFIIEDETDCI